MAPGDIEVRGNRRELFLNIGLFFLFLRKRTLGSDFVLEST